MLWFKQYVATEENASETLRRMQKSCNKYYMIRYDSVRDNATGKISYRHFPCHIIVGIKRKITNHGEIYKRTRKFSGIISSFIHCMEHVYFKRYKEGNNSNWNDIPYYTNKALQPLVHLDLYGGGAMLLSVGDKIRFFPFGAFAITSIDNLTSNDIENFEIFFPNLFHHIKDFDAENTKRGIEWEEEAKAWNDLEYGKVDDDDGFDEDSDVDDEFDMRDLID